MESTSKFQSVRRASQKLVRLPVEQIDLVLNELAQATRQRKADLLSANQSDLYRMDSNDPKYDRLKLTPERIDDIANDIAKVAGLDCPIGETLEHRILENGLDLAKIRVPLGVVGIIYEARPNVSFDVFSLCLKTKNACVLKGGSDAEFSNRAIVSLIHEVLDKFEIDRNVVHLLPADRQAASDLLHAVGDVDLIIPRGSQNLINFVRENSQVPVIETGAGIVHVYFDKSGDLAKGQQIVCNSKTRRASVCNALDCLLIHRDRLECLPAIAEPLAEKNTTIYADDQAESVLENAYPVELLHPALNEHFGTEFLSNKLAIKTVANIDEALQHIAEYSSRHSEAIVAEDNRAIETFLEIVDAAAVYANTSTAFTDGAQFGMGAEIGISTQKLHARGPMALNEMTTYKWVIRGTGQIRNP